MKFLHVSRYWFLLIYSLPILLFAKSPKPTLLIYGSTIEAYVAAWQGANSGVPTVWINPDSYSFDNDLSVLKNQKEGLLLDDGTLTNFSETSSNSSDSTQQDLFGINSGATDNKLTHYSDLLSIVSGVDVAKIEFTGKKWKINLTNKKSYEVHVVLDASEGNALLKRTKLSSVPLVKFTKSTDLDLADSRSVVFVGEFEKDIYSAKLPDLLTQKDNFFVLNLEGFTFGVNKPFRLAYGQVMGAIASYCAFFKTTADKIDLRTLQNELIMHKARLLPYSDVSSDEVNFNSLQRIYLAGILPLRKYDNHLVFGGSDSVRVEDVKSVINQFYSRTQLWFVDNKPAYFTVHDVLDLIKFAAFRGEELNIEVSKNWSKILKFDGDYNPSRAVTRYEFAVLFDKYADPFVKKVSQDGKEIKR